MPLPVISTTTGYLPSGAHDATADEVEERFVTELAPSANRPVIFQWWRLHRQALDELVSVTAQWLGGSFISAKPEPSDVDLCTVFDGPAFDSQPDHRRAMALALLNGHYTRDFWKCDSFRIATYPPGQPGHAEMVAAMDYWHAWWSKTRPDENGDQVDRGYVVTP